MENISNDIQLIMSWNRKLRQKEPSHIPRVLLFVVLCVGYTPLEWNLDKGVPKLLSIPPQNVLTLLAVYIFPHILLVYYSKVKFSSEPNLYIYFNILWFLTSFLSSPR